MTRPCSVGDGLLVCDLGLDAVVGYELGDGRLTEVTRSAMWWARGRGTSSSTAAAAYVLGELVVDGDGMRRVRIGPRCRGRPSRSARWTRRARSTAARPRWSATRRSASNRGRRHRRRAGRAAVARQPVESVPCGGSWPRWMGLVDGALLLLTNAWTTWSGSAPDGPVVDRGGPGRLAEPDLRRDAPAAVHAGGPPDQRTPSTRQTASRPRSRCSFGAPGMAWSQVRWEEPPMDDRGRRARRASRRLGAPPSRGRSISGRGPPTQRMATIVSSR